MPKRSEEYYQKEENKIRRRLAQLPVGTIKERVISGRTYFYLQRREGKKVLHTYLGKQIPVKMKKLMTERKLLRAKLEKLRKILREFWVAELKDLWKKPAA